MKKNIRNINLALVLMGATALTGCGNEDKKAQPAPSTPAPQEQKVEETKAPVVPANSDVASTPAKADEAATKAEPTTIKLVSADNQ